MVARLNCLRRNRVSPEWNPVFKLTLASHSRVWLSVTKSLWRYMVKPHESLVLVSSMPHSTYTPNLSTS